jgi:hypothetical protein
MFAKRNIFLTYLSLQRINQRDRIDHSLSIWNGCIQKQYRTRKKRINNKRATAIYTPLLYNSKYNNTILLRCTDLFCLRMATSMFHGKSTALEVVQGLNVKLDGKVVLITGATSGMNIELVRNFSKIRSPYEGIGTETARALASVDAHVIITARDMNKGAQVVEDIKKSTGNDKVEVMEMDLTSLQSVRNFVSQFRARKLPINILICM